MTHAACSMTRPLSVAPVLLLGVTLAGAQGGGSLGLDEVLEAVKYDPKHTYEMHDELKWNCVIAD